MLDFNKCFRNTKPLKNDKDKFKKNMKIQQTGKNFIIKIVTKSKISPEHKCEIMKP